MSLFRKEGVILTFLAHSENCYGQVQILKDHLLSVAKTAKHLGSKINLDDLAYFTGLLHDVGKYGDKFQRRLSGLETGVDHWSFGARLAATYSTRSVAFAQSAVAIQGHHIGLQRLNKVAIKEMLDYNALIDNHPMGLGLSESNEHTLMKSILSDGMEIKIPHLESKRNTKISDMLDTRMLFSTLVDADFIDTNNHFREPSKITIPKLEPNKALAELSSYIDSIRDSSKGTEIVDSIRNKLRDSCNNAAVTTVGLFTLSAPTGSGKTLSMLSFALKHAVENDLDRVILVIPFLSIIDQTACVYRDALSPIIKRYPNYVFEHHSNSSFSLMNEQEVDDATRARNNALSSNWSSPIIITTSVQFLHSLFSNRPFACRKLHNMSKSVILFDEVQSLPTKLILPTLSALARLSDRYRSTVVFSTATQPAFTHLSGEVEELSDYKWKPYEIVPDNEDFYSKLKRVEVDWSMVKKRVTYEEIAKRLSKHKQAICVCNLKWQAREISLLVNAQMNSSDRNNLFFMSTELPPAHRMNVVREIRRKLDDNQGCILVSTQCIEAGVDVDFPVAYRALGPLDSIAQVAGRCNRNGRLDKGLMYVFKPKDDGKRSLYPFGGDYANASAITESLLNEMGDLDIDNPKIFTRYYEKLYDLVRSQTLKLEFRNAIESGDFIKVAELYKIIDQDTVSVLVPYDITEYYELANEVRRSGINAGWMRKALKHSIQVYRSRIDDFKPYIEPVPVYKNTVSTDFFIYLYPDHYDPRLGLMLPEEHIQMCV